MSSFDRVQHDALMARAARRVHDKQVLRLIRAYLEAGVMADGLVHASEEGTPQGSPLSPLLSNIMLDDLDWELDRRGHRFVRYADDGRIYVHSRRAGERVMQSVTHYIEQRLKLRVNRQKSAVAPAVERPLLGFQFFRYRDGRIGVTVAPKALKRAPDRIRQLTTRNRGVSMERRIKEINRFTVGWTAYFAFADTILPFDNLEKWLRRRLRQVRWKEWKRSTNALPEPPSTRDPRPRRPLLGSVAEGVLARRRILATPTRPAERLLAQDRWPERIPRRGQGKPGLYPIPYGGQPEPTRRRAVPTATPRRPPTRARARHRFVGEVYGYQKQGASYGYTKKLGYHPITAVRADTGEVLHIRNRKGKANTQRGIARFLDELLARVKRAGHTGQIIIRADTGFENHKLMGELAKRGIFFSIGVKLSKTIRALIEQIPETAWMTVADYPDGGQAQVAETQLKGFRLIVRRTRLTGAQAELFPDWRHHCFATNRTIPLLVADTDHRDHASIELAIRDLTDQALCHFPSGRMHANSAWTVIAALAHNLGRWTSQIGLPDRPIQTARSRRRQLLAVPARLTRTSRQWTLRMPARWPWQRDFNTILHQVRALPRLT